MVNVPRIGSVVLAALAFAPAFTAEEVAATPWYRQINVNGYVSASFSYGFNRPVSATNQFRVFDVDDDTFTIDVAELTVRRDAIRPGDVGFRADAAAGSSFPRVTAAAGLFRDAQTGKAQDVDLFQAYVSFVAPVGSGLRIDAGKFITHMGYEAIDRFDATNDNATRSFLFGFAVPFTHTGLRASYTFSSQWAGQLHLVNGWDDVKDNNRGKSVGMELSWTPKDTLAIVLNYMGGPEQPQDNSSKRHVGDLVINWTVTPKVYLGLNADYGRESGIAPGGGASVWRGIAAYARVGLGGAWSIALRGEVFDDRDGTRTGTAQRLTGLTLTPLCRLDRHGTAGTLILRADLRLDTSDRPVFESDAAGAFKKSQPTIALNAAYLF